MGDFLLGRIGFNNIVESGETFYKIIEQRSTVNDVSEHKIL